MDDKLDKLRGAMRAEIEAIPKTMRQEQVIRQALIWLLANAVRQMGLKPVPGWKPPRSTREGIDLVAVDDSGEQPAVMMAFVVDPLVELPRLKNLEWVDCPQKVVVSFSERTDKVAQTSFFLGKEHTHLKLYD